MKSLHLISIILAQITTVLGLSIAPSYGQLTGLSIEAGINYPIIGTQEETSDFSLPPTTGFSNFSIGTDTKEEYNTSVGINFDVLTKVNLSEKFDLNLGLGINYIRFDRDVSINANAQTLNSVGVLGDLFGLGDLFDSLSFDNNIEPLGATANFPLKIVYLNIPIHVAYQVHDKFYVSGGITIMQRLYSKTRTQSFINDIGGGQVIETDDTSGDGLEDTQFALGVVLGYQFYKDFSVTLSYDRALTPIYSSEQQLAGEAKFNLVNLGIAYHVNFSKSTQ